MTAAGEEILAATLALMALPGFPADRSEQAREALKTFLAGHRPVPTPWHYTYVREVAASD